MRTYDTPVRDSTELSMTAVGRPVIFTSPTVRRAQAFVEEVSDEDDSSIDSTPVDTRRNSFIENVMTEEQLAEYAAGIPLPNDVGAGVDNVSVGHYISSFIVPKNFARVVPRLYRSSFPLDENLSFMRCLQLRTILTLVDEDYSEAQRKFVARGHIQHFQVSIKAHKKRGDKIDEEYMAAALKEVLNPANYPMLVHCNKGKHRTGCVMACLRKISGWPLEDVIGEYRKYAGAKARELDVEYITEIDVQALRTKLATRVEIPLLPPEPFADSPLSALAVNSTRLRG